jgi:hypothetical protein
MNMRAAIIVACLLSTSVVQAELIETNWKNTGDALATLDTDTGIEWLDLTQTEGMSINQAERLTGAGNIFEGWRLPTRAEVTELMTHAFPSEASNLFGDVRLSVTNIITDDEADRFLALLGQTHDFQSFDFTLGLFKNDDGQSYNVISSGVEDTNYSNDVQIRLNNNRATDYNYLHQAYGVYLVSDGGTTLSSQLDPSINANNANAPVADVSIPALLGLMSLGLFGFAACRRHFNSIRIK